MSDPRFARLKTDPRFRRPRKHQSKVVVDERFKSVFQPKQKSKGKNTTSVRVDKYGRALAEGHDEENLKRFYRLENDEESGSNVPDYARGGVLMESSDEEDNLAEEEDERDDEGFITIGQDASRPMYVTDEGEEVDLDENHFADLDAEAAAYNKNHSESELVLETADRTNRLAIVNLDWEHVRAVHLFKICTSLVSPTAPTLASTSKPNTSGQRQHLKGTTIARGKVLSVKVYPSEFGKKRMVREEKEGPPPELFRKKGKAEGEEINERTIYDVGDENDFDEDALRKYQLDRLRYYYAIVSCDTVDAASHIYNELDGTELERSANVFDLSFVPNDMTFEDEPRDEANEDVETGYRAVEFVTDALRHSKVKLTWDEDDPERSKVTRRTITRKELGDGDFQAYIASASESESELEDNRNGLSRDKLRSLLLGGNDQLPEGWNRDDGVRDNDVDMEVTFMPGLADRKDGQDETTLEKYQRKMKEKRKKRKEEVKKAVTADDDFFDATSDGDHSAHESKKKSGATLSYEPTEEEAHSLLVSHEDSGAEPQHFNLKAVMKVERKQKKNKKKGKKTVDEDNEIQEDFILEVNDDRFKAIHEDHNFAIDPTHPQFKKTKAMESLLNERSQRRAVSEKQHAEDGQSLKNLVDKVKRKGSLLTEPRKGKRQRLR
ncbi:hypothetical protein E1B28_001049 [Marasmius oreades]|uniref:NUC153 domain-containing protein n=1 Tax=Marasmius oreades TaxID=181124 RepID=A0A9P8AF93_9AGAR|nr:uncharacterized protein E1B28_001049 [Marasmius oreades]KAG7099180.1 hypothetical protein E1B28_001049 [Marasmius oreades]